MPQKDILAEEVAQFIKAEANAVQDVFKDRDIMNLLTGTLSSLAKSDKQNTTLLKKEMLDLGEANPLSLLYKTVLELINNGLKPQALVTALSRV